MTNSDDDTVLPEAAAESGWVWVEKVTGFEEIIGASQKSPAQAWALSILTSKASTVEDLRAAEALRENGEMELRPASPDLCSAWARVGRRVEWQLHEGVAVTVDEYADLTNDGTGQATADPSASTREPNGS